MRFLLTALTCLLAIPSLALAHDGVHAKNAYALQTAPGATVGAVFVDLAAPEATANDALLKIVTPRATKAEIHSMTTDDMGIMKMRPLDKLVIPMGKTTALKQDGDHIMLLGLTSPLIPGETFPITLTFERGETIDAIVTVKAMGDTTPSPTTTDTDMNDMNHDAH